MRRGRTGGLCRAFLGVFLMLSGNLAAQADPLPAALELHGTALQQRLQQVWQQADHLDAISTGPVHAARHILIFFDPNCPFCAHLWRSLQPWSARVRMRWVPVAFLRPSSLPMAATLLASKHPAQQLTQNEQHYQFRTRTGGILPLAQPPAGLLQQVRRNTALWLANFDVTPTLLYRGPHKLHDALGFPSHAQLRHWLGPA
ncbi:thioredoxin fold domain-containing protein [Acidithiobacillus thiooxidans]|nr:thioredoxin fold domain-containing protein [Acidithiobacillus thiooxidans]